jgi:hypothetical protein
MGRVRVDAGPVHPDGVDRGGVDHAADARAVRGLPDGVGAEEVGLPQLLEGALVGDRGEVDDHLGTREQGLHLLDARDVGLGPGLVGQEVRGVLDVDGGQRLARSREGLAQAGAQRARRAGQDDLSQHDTL